MKQSYNVFNCRAWLVAMLLCFVSLPCWAEEADGLVYEVDSEKKTATVTDVTSRDSILCMASNIRLRSWVSKSYKAKASSNLLLGLKVCTILSASIGRRY